MCLTGAADFRRVPDHAVLPLEVVLEQLEILGIEIVPLLRTEMAANRPPHVSDAPTHQSLHAVPGFDAISEAELAIS